MGHSHRRPLLIVIAAYAHGGTTPVLILAITLTGWSYGARQLRAQALSLRNRDFLESARVRGERRSYVIVFEVLPTMTSLHRGQLPGAARCTRCSPPPGCSSSVSATRSSMSWGTMLHWAQNNGALQTGQPLWVVAPGLCVAAAGRLLRPAQLRVRRDQQPGPATRRGEARDPARRFLTPGRSRAHCSRCVA